MHVKPVSLGSHSGAAAFHAAAAAVNISIVEEVPHGGGVQASPWVRGVPVLQRGDGRQVEHQPEERGEDDHAQGAAALGRETHHGLGAHPQRRGRGRGWRRGTHGGADLQRHPSLQFVTLCTFCFDTFLVPFPESEFPFFHFPSLCFFVPSPLPFN